MPDQLTERVLKTIAETQRVPVETVTEDKTFEELNIDSMDGVNILFALENEFEIAIPDEAARSIRTVSEMVQGVRDLVEKKPATAPPPAAP
jgi:acyl carrier protein